jgi:hypothetical protein
MDIVNTRALAFQIKIIGLIERVWIHLDKYFLT